MQRVAEEEEEVSLDRNKGRLPGGGGIMVWSGRVGERFPQGAFQTEGRA